MGGNTSKVPNTIKNLKDFECDLFRIGLGEMQGWRDNMEDASLIHIAKNHSKIVKTYKEQLDLSKSFKNPFKLTEENTKEKEKKNEKQKDNKRNSNFSFNSQKSNKSSKKSLEDYFHENKKLEEGEVELSINSQDETEESSINLILKEMRISNEEIRKKITRELEDKCPENNISMIGVFDGHGGSFVSRLVAENFITMFRNSWIKYIIKNDMGNFRELTKDSSKSNNLKLYNRKMLEQILLQTFLDFDEVFYNKKCQEIVNEYKTFRRDDLVIKNLPQLLTEDLDMNIHQLNFAHFMGTTANLICLYDNNLLISNIGDSISVLYADGKAVFLNTEHKVTVPGEEERIKKSGKTIINGRVDGKLNLTRAIGDLQFKNKRDKPHEQAVTVYPEFNFVELDDTCEFVVTACDGIWDCVEPQKLCEFISLELKKGKEISEIISYIEDMVISKTNNSPIGTDNMTCIIMQFK